MREKEDKKVKRRQKKLNRKECKEESDEDDSNEYWRRGWNYSQDRIRHLAGNFAFLIINKFNFF